MAANDRWQPRAWYPLYPKDILTDPAYRALTWEQRGRYREALDWAWLAGSGGRAKPEQWAAWLGIDPRKLSPFRPCFRVSRGVWEQQRLAKEWRKAIESRDRSSLGANVTNSKRWGSVAIPIAERSLAGRQSQSQSEAQSEAQTPPNLPAPERDAVAPSRTLPRRPRAAS